MGNVCLMCLIDEILGLPCSKVHGLDTYARFWMFVVTRLPGGLRNRLSVGAVSCCGGTYQNLRT